MNKLMTAVMLMGTAALAACGGGGGGGTATNTSTNETVNCTANALSYTVTCGDTEISVTDIAGMTDNGDGTYTVQYMGATWIVRPTSYDSTVVADIITAHQNGITGQGAVITTFDFFEETSGHGEHVKSIIDAIAPDADTPYYDITGSYTEIFNNLNHDILNYTGNQSTDVYNFSLGSYLSDADYHGTFATTEVLHNSAIVSSGAIINSAAVFVVSAGNDAQGDQEGSNGIHKDCSDWSKCNFLASVIANTVLDDQLIVVGALDATGENLATYSTQAGILQDHYIVTAVVPTQDGGLGTSYAAPVVSGVAGLIESNMAGNQHGSVIVNRILSTTDDLGAVGTDAVFGRGRLNVGRALSPVGGLQ